MKIRLDIQKKTVVPASFLLLLSIFAWNHWHIRIWTIPVFLLAFVVFSNLKIELDEKLAWLWTAIMVGISGFFTTYLVQYLLLTRELFKKTAGEKYVLNALCCMVVYLLVMLIGNNLKVACITGHAFLWVFGMINYFVYQFRGNEFSVADVTSAVTGLSVASKYSFSVNNRFLYVLMASVGYFVFVSALKVKFKSVWKMRAASIMFIAVVVSALSVKTSGMITETWEQKGTYRNGYFLNFVLQIRDSFVLAPEGYEDQIIGQLEEHYSGKGQTSSDSSKKPNVIVIMNESFADLRVLGDFSTNRPMMPFLDSLKENTIRGWALSSVYGAKTPNSEWEFLTGNSMAFLPQGSVVYQQYIDRKSPYSLVQVMKDNDYTCVAMHPYFATGWKRNTIYPTMGFDEMHFIDDFDESKKIREYITDEEFYDKLIERFEKKDQDEKLFIMSVSMQNHGGYGQAYDNFTQKIRKTGGSYVDGNQYLSLVYESDKAIEKLINYFDSIDEPVEVVFFGDHQPGLSSAFLTLINGVGVSNLTNEQLQKFYTVPFFIWTNYETEAEEVEITSLNYLSTIALKRAGIALPQYNQFLDDMMDVIPAINSRGYYSPEKGEYLYHEDASGDEAQWIADYNMLQYNCMFDRHRSQLFFPKKTKGKK